MPAVRFVEGAIVRCALALGLLLLFNPARAQQIRLQSGGETLGQTDLPGSDIGHFQLPDVPPAPPGGISLDLRQQQCMAACGQSGSACLAFTYVLPNTTQGPHAQCWLKSTLPPTKAATCCVSGTVADVNVDRPGGDYNHTTMATANGCAASCQADSKCSAWSFVRPNTTQGPQGQCWLKSTASAQQKNNCCVSGTILTETLQ